MLCRRLGIRGLGNMISKRILVYILVTVCVILGLYLGFFNHPPAAETLAINLHKGSSNNNADGIRRPQFRHLHFGHDHAKTSAIRALNLYSVPQSGESAKVAQFRTAGNQTESTNSITQSAHNSSNEKNIVNLKQTKDHQQEEPAKHPQDQQGITHPSVRDPNERDSGWNAGEDDFVEDKQALLEAAHDEDKVNAGRSKEYGPHHIRIFDWDGWIKDNNFIDVGNLWAYCDDPDPPRVGKVIIAKDEEYGSGVKVVIIMNSTFEENIEFGKITLNVDVGGVHFLSKKYDSCALVSKSEFFKCPMLAGDKYFYLEKHIPAFLPTGEYRVESQLTDHFERTIVCAQVKMTL